MAEKSERKLKEGISDTLVEIHFPAKISIELVQANELRHYEIFSWFTSLIATIAVGFWVAYFTTNPRSGQLFWTAVAFSSIFVFSLGMTIYYRRKVSRDSLIKTVT